MIIDLPIPIYTYFHESEKDLLFPNEVRFQLGKYPRLFFILSVDLSNAYEAIRLTQEDPFYYRNPKSHAFPHKTYITHLLLLDPTIDNGELTLSNLLNTRFKIPFVYKITMDILSNTECWGMIRSKRYDDWDKHLEDDFSKASRLKDYSDGRDHRFDVLWGIDRDVFYKYIGIDYVRSQYPDFEQIFLYEMDNILNLYFSDDVGPLLSYHCNATSPDSYTLRGLPPFHYLDPFPKIDYLRDSNHNLVNYNISLIPFEEYMDSPLSYPRPPDHPPPM